MFRKFLREYLSFTRGERNGILVLSCMLLATILLKSVLPSLFQPAAPSLAGMEEVLAGQAGTSTAPGPDPVHIEYHAFDPNTAGLAELCSLGIPQRTAQILINYREKGGGFDRSEDLLKVYGMQEETYALLEPYIMIPPKEKKHSGDPGSKIVKAVRDSSQMTMLPWNHEKIASSRFDLNLADTGRLRSVYGIGPVFASRIVRYRELLGGFYALDQLREVYGLTEEQFQSLSGSCFTDTAGVRKLDLNRAGEPELLRHPYLDQYQVDALMSYRKLMGAFHDPMEISQSRLLPREVFERIYPYLGIGE